MQTWQDGAYLFMLETESVDDEDYHLKVTVSFKYKSGYLSANDWPFLPVSFFSLSYDYDIMIYVTYNSDNKL